jgi:plasmid stabilization system protein ParE
LRDLSGELPGNLSRQAADDLNRILRRSAREFGVTVARQSRARLLAVLRAIEAGTVIGHRRHDVQPRRPTVFFNETPWVICFHPDTRRVYRILHGAQDFPALFGDSDPAAGTRGDTT